MIISGFFAYVILGLVLLGGVALIADLITVTYAMIRGRIEVDGVWGLIFRCK